MNLKINSIEMKRLSVLDGFEIKSATFINKSFPAHFHLDWSLAFIEKGSENIQFDRFNFLLNRNAVILIPPFSVHANWGNEGNIWAYKAILHFCSKPSSREKHQ